MRRRELRGAREGAQERLAVDRDLPDAARLRRILPARSEPRQRRRKRTRIHRPEQPREGGVAGKPVLRGTDRHRIASLMTAKSAMSTQVRPPHRLEGSATVSLSIKSRRFALLLRGSSTPFERSTEFFHVPPLRKTSVSDTLSSYTALGADQQTLEIECLPP